MNAPLHHYIDSLVLGDSCALGPITIVPLRSSAAAPMDLALLSDETAVVAELSEGGSVGWVRVESLVGMPLLLVAGELLRGAKQNRQVDQSLLIPPGREQRVKVTCVERGRWAFRGERGFRAAGATLPWHMRSRSSSRSLKAKLRMNRADADQGTVWREVDQHLRRKRRQSGTSDLLAAMDTELHEAVAAWTPAGQDVGGAFFVGGELVGLECFISPAAWKSAARRVLVGLVEEACGVKAPAEEPNHAEAVTALLQKLRGMELERTAGEGMGDELQGESEKTHLAALVAELEPGAGVQTVHLRVGIMDKETPEPLGRVRRRGRDDDFESIALSRRLAEPRSRQNGLSQEEVLRRTRALSSLLARPQVTVGGACLVLLTTEYERLIRFGSLPTGVPLPHRSAGGLSVYRHDSIYALQDLAELFENAGSSKRSMWMWNGSRESLQDRPRWLEVVSVHRNGIVLREVVR